MSNPKETAGYKLTGPLLDLLANYEAPKPTQRAIARRAGNLAGTPLFPLSVIERAIEDSMGVNYGIPNWERIEESVAKRAANTYKRLRR